MTVPTPGDLVFVEDIPPRPNPFGDSKWLPVLEALKLRVKEWALLATFATPKEANACAGNLRQVTKKRGKFKIVVRKTVVYARYEGDTK